jgi:hypothetical protein
MNKMTINWYSKKQATVKSLSCLSSLAIIGKCEGCWSVLVVGEAELAK